MQGYDKKEAVEYIASKIDRSEFAGVSESRIRSLIQKAIELDFEYMEENGVLKGGMMGDSFYDDDDAYDFICENLLREIGADDDEELIIAHVVDAYMDCQQDYMQERGLLQWED